MPIDIHLKDKLEALDKLYGGDEMFRIFGPTMLSWATTDSSRMYMFTSHLKQTLTLLNPDVSHLLTGFENIIGEKNHAYKKLEGSWEVVNIIPKFSSLEEIEVTEETIKNQIVMVVLYNKKTDTYDMYEKPIAENLTEKFGYIYDNSVIDSLKVGQKLKDPILYKSTSYDEHMNYRYGKNARVYHSTSTDTIEDALIIRKGWADSVTSVEIDKVSVPINDNDILLNLYGDDDNYVPFPRIGQKVKNSLICATRRINRNHLLYDFQKSHMQELMDTDTDYYVSKNSVVYDINVYYNGDAEFPDNLFYKELRKYYQDGCDYAKNILEVTNQIKNSGSNYTQNVSHYRSIYLTYNDPRYMWKNNDKIFGNIVVEFYVKSEVSLELGSKISGRYGNKGVISRIGESSTESFKDSVVDLVGGSSMSEDERRILKESITIVDDSRMPYYYSPFGEKIYVDVMVNSSGAIRRLNPGQLTEVETNFIAEQVRFKVMQAETREEKVEIIFKFLDAICSKVGTYFRTLYNSYDQLKMINGMNVRLIAPESMDAFIKDIETHGFYIVRPPHQPILFDEVIKLYETFPDIKPIDIYVDLFGTRNRKMIKKGVVGYEYCIILKQNSNKNFSARSTFRVNRSNLPAKDIAKKTNRSAYARTPVRLSEIYNLLASVSGEDLAEYNIFMRSSALGRKSLDRILSADSNPLKIKKLKIKDNYTNANADILAARLKSIGLRIFMSPLPEGRVQMYNMDAIYPLHFGEYTIYDKPQMRGVYQELFTEFKKELKTILMVETYRGEKYDLAWNRVFAKCKAADSISDETKERLRVCTKGHASTVLEKLNPPKIKTRVATSSETPAPKKRGRKSKAELAQLLLEKENAKMANTEEESPDEIEDDVLNDSLTYNNEEDDELI